MESLLALFLIIPKAIRPIDNSYVKYFLYSLVFIVMVLTSLTPIQDLIISNGELVFDFTALRKTNYYIIILLGLFFQYFLNVEKKIDYKIVFFQATLISWFMIIDSKLLYLSMGYMVVQFLYSSVVIKKNIEITTTILLVISSFMYEYNMFNLSNIYVYILNTLALLCLFFSIRRISCESFNLTDYIFILINMTLLKSYATETNLADGNILLGLVLTPALYAKDRVTMLTKFLVFTLTICIVNNDFNYYLIAPLYTLIFILYRVGVKTKTEVIPWVNLVSALLLISIPICLKLSLINFSNHIWILITLLILLLAEIGKRLIINGLDYKDRHTHFVLSLFILFAIMGVFI